MMKPTQQLLLWTLALSLVVPSFASAQSVEIFLNKADNAYKAGHFIQAIEAYDQALKLKPNEAGTYLLRATAYYQLSNFVLWNGLF